MIDLLAMFDWHVNGNLSVARASAEEFQFCATVTFFTTLWAASGKVSFSGSVFDLEIHSFLRSLVQSLPCEVVGDRQGENCSV